MPKTIINLFLSFSILLSSAVVLADDRSCGVKYDISKYFYKINTCDDSGLVLIIKEFFAETDKLSNSTHVDSVGRRQKRVNYSSSGDFNIKLYKYTEDSVVELQYEKNSDSLLKDKLEKDLSTGKKITDWEIVDGVIKWIDRFLIPNEKQIVSREFIEEKVTYEFTYKPSSAFGDEVESFVIRDNSQNVIGRYQYKFDGDVRGVLAQQFTGAELLKRLSQFADTFREVVAVIDSGFDLYHSSITPFLVNNPGELWGEVDHDGNGLAGDVFGWSDNSLTGLSGNINETVIIGGFKPYPLSHGTHVASIALEGQIDFALYGFAGDVGKHSYLDTVSKQITDKSIKLVNMSWGFKEQGYPQTPPINTYSSLKKLISTNSQSLFFVAAGNNGWDIDGDLKDYPASYSYNNTIVIGALNVPDYSWSSGENLISALFKNNLGSNYGKKSVDIFAPGKLVSGAKLGGGHIPMSGTSMASPYAMNTAMSVRGILPKLSSLELKELLLKTAGHPEKPLECVSEGFIHPKRAVRVASLLAESNDLTLEQAIIDAIEFKEDLYPGEVLKSLEELRRIWSNIDSSLLINEE